MIKIDSKKGFTILELLVVIAIIGLIGSIVTISLNDARMKARDAKRKLEINAIGKAMEMYYNEHSSYLICDTAIPWNNCCSYDTMGCSSAHYPTSIGEYMHVVPKDPLNNDTYYYTFRNSPDVVGGTYGQGFCVFARLEVPGPMGTGGIIWFYISHIGSGESNSMTIPGCW